MSHSVDDTYEVYDRTVRKARQEHKCCACKETIRRGDLYTYVSIIYDGHPTTYKRCARCEAIFETLRRELSDDGQWPDEDLNCGHEWSENFSEPPPEEVARLAFMTKDEVQAMAHGMRAAKAVGEFFRYAAL